MKLTWTNALLLKFEPLSRNIIQYGKTPVLVDEVNLEHELDRVELIQILILKSLM